MVSCPIQKILSLTGFPPPLFLVLLLFLLPWENDLQKQWYDFYVRECLTMLSFSLWCHVLCLSFSAILRLFLWMLRGCVLTSLIFKWLYNWSQQRYWRDCLFPIVYACFMCWRLFYCRFLGLFLDSLYSFPLIHISVFATLSHCFHYCSYAVLYEVLGESCFLLCSFSSGLLWQFWVFYCSM